LATSWERCRLGDERSSNGSGEPGIRRVTALDGLRGSLAVLVAVYHAFDIAHNNFLFLPSQIAVVMFFIISGYALTKSWNGQYFAFLARRFIRLWPVYAVCLAAAYVIAGPSPIWTEFFWYPYMGPLDRHAVDPPMWSLILEAWVMPVMPFVIWSGTHSVARAAWTMLFVIIASYFFIYGLVQICFIAGAFLSRADIRWRWLETPIPQWLGKISYSLYLSHILVMILLARAVGLWGGVIGLPVTLLVGWGLWRTVEQPSIELSRRVGKMLSVAPG